MFDHVLRFDSEEEAIEFIPEYRSDGGWNESITLPNQKVYIVEDENREYFSGWFITIMLTEVSENLKYFPNNVCRLIANREAAIEGKPFIVYVASDMTPEVLSFAKIEPVAMGSNYPFGSV